MFNSYLCKVIFSNTQLHFHEHLLLFEEYMILKNNNLISITFNVIIYWKDDKCNHLNFVEIFPLFLYLYI